MPFELPEVTKVTITNANPRREFHGEDRVRAIDLAFALKGENTLLDLIEPGLRKHHYCNKAYEAGQADHDLSDLSVDQIPLPNVRHPKLPLAYHYAKGEKGLRGYRLIRDYGTNLGNEAFDFTDVVLSNMHYEFAEGGSCTIYATLQYNGEELEDNDTYGMLSGLASEGDIHIRLLAPPTLLPVKKGYRAGKPDTPQPQPKNAAQREIGDGGDGDSGGDSSGEGGEDSQGGSEGDDSLEGGEGQAGHVGDAGAFQTDADDDRDVQHEPGSPEAALANTEPKA